MSHATDSARAWSSHRTLPIPKKLTAFERHAKYNLGLDLNNTEELLANENLKHWAKQHRNDCFIPEPFLKYWKLTDEWMDRDSKPSPRVSMADVRAYFAEQKQSQEEIQ